MPTELLLARHGESKGNVMREAAEGRGAEALDLDTPDAEVDLSETGEAQAVALGKWLAGQPADRQPNLVVSSPYRRAWRTAEIVVEAAGLAGTVHTDERVRDRELGILDGLTSVGVRNRHPEEAARRARLGKFYYRPPGGESWADVALRVRTFVAEIGVDAGRILVVTHDATIMNFRYVLQHLPVRRLLDIAASTSVLNCSLTRLVRERADGTWRLADFNSIDHLREFEAPVTKHDADHDVHPR